MPFENDPDGYRIAVGYAGRDFDKARTVCIDAMHEYFGKWTLEEFQELVASAVATIPPEYRSSAIVEMYDPGYDGATSLRMHYVAPESAATVTDRIERCEKYVAELRAGERATYEMLKAKFG